MSDLEPPDPDEFERRAAERRAGRRARKEPSTPRAPRYSRKPREPRPPSDPREARNRRVSMPKLPSRPTNTKRWVPAAALALAVLFVLWFVTSLFQPFKGDGDGRVQVTVPRGSGTGDIAQLLEREGVIPSSTFFELRLTLSGGRGDIQAGPYTLARNMSYGAAIDALTEPPERRVLAVTVPEGLSRLETSRVVKEAGLKGNYETATRRSASFDPTKYGASRRVRNLEGFLFPATYELKPGSDAADLVAQQLRAFERQIEKVSLSRAKEKNLTAYDVLIIASMVEREVSVPKERRLVAAVIYNRLKASEPLGIDATIRFATRNWDKPLSNADLAIDSDFNTRRRAGLPPTPIGSPGLASIRAAANPANSDAFYYVVKPNTCNEHTFTRTQAEFNEAQAAYERARQERGGRAPTTCPDGG